jgi:D-methionine transport system ATP-binding protein
LLCDEATSALDPETTESILNLLANIRDELGVTIVLITHQMEVIQAIADRVVVMSGGKVVEENDVLSILMSPEHPTTMRFVRSITDSGGFPSLADKKVYRLSYIGELASRPLISKISQDYLVDVNILQGKINRTGKATYGTLYVTIVGDREEEAINYVKQQGVKVVIEHDSVE